jgi:hypothetical protein
MTPHGITGLERVRCVIFVMISTLNKITESAVPPHDGYFIFYNNG